MQTFSYQAQLADLGVSMACTYTTMAMSGAFAVAALAFTAPFVFAASARPMHLPAAVPTAEVPAPACDPYSAYRSDGGHATTLVLMGPMPQAR